MATHVSKREAVRDPAFRHERPVLLFLQGSLPQRVRGGSGGWEGGEAPCLRAIIERRARSDHGQRCLQIERDARSRAQ